MAHFVNVPSLDIGRKRHWLLTDNLIYQSDLLDAEVVVVAGFETDLASIPTWVPRWLADPTGRHRGAAIVHDFLVRQPGFDRKKADEIFLEAMKVEGVKRWRRRMMWRAVSVQTWWKRRRKK